MKKDIIIIGAGAAGLTAGIYAARAGKSVLVLEQDSIGGQINGAPQIENYPGFTSITGMEFSENLFMQAESVGVELELETVEQLIPGPPHTVVTDCGRHEASAVIVATGVRRRHLDVPGEDLLGVSYCAVCDGAFYRDKVVTVVGGGNTALQSVELLAGTSRLVYLVHRNHNLRAEQYLVERVMGLPNVEPLLGVTVDELLPDPADPTSVGGAMFFDAACDCHAPLAMSAMFICVGQVPGNQPFADVLTLDETGYIVAGEDCATNVPGIFAAGDCRTKQVRQLTTAAADGAVAALGALKFT